MTGNRLVDTILVGLSTLVAVALLGVFVYTEVIYEPPPIDQTKIFEELNRRLETQAMLPTYKLDQLIINLPSPTRRLRFLDVEMHLVSFDASYHALYEDKKPQIRDLIIDTASRMEPEELNSVTGKILLEDRLRRGVNQIVGTNAVKEVLFARFVVQ